MRFLESRHVVLVDELLTASHVCLGKRTRREAKMLLQDLRWSWDEVEGTWTRPRAAGDARPQDDALDAASIETRVLTAVQDGVWTAANLSRKVGLPSRQVVTALRRLVAQDFVRQLPGTPSALYHINPASTEAQGKQP